MKLLCLFTICLVTGFPLAQSTNDDENEGLENTGLLVESPNEKRIALKRIVRNTFSGMSETLIMRMEATIISNCKQKGHQQAALSLQDTYSEMESCLRKKRIIATPKAEFMSNLEECTKDAVTKTKTCLDEKQKYFPEFILQLVKSVVNFMYNDVIYLRDEITPCLPRLSAYSVRREYIQCLTDTSTKHHDTNQIPSSKEEFCKTFIPASICFTDMLKNVCDRTTGLETFRKDYIDAMKIPCESKEY